MYAILKAGFIYVISPRTERGLVEDSPWKGGHSIRRLIISPFSYSWLL
jgi:hypothetical protein